jgi:UDP-glucose 4-epimerase
MSMKKSKVLVCGAAGFIGSYTTAIFHEAGWEVAGAGRGDALSLEQYPNSIGFHKGDFESAIFTSELLNKIKPNLIIFAAGTADVQRSVIDPVRDFQAQLLPLAQLLYTASQMKSPPKILLVSSAAIYGDIVKIPVSESDSPNPISPYGFHKLAQEALLDEFNKLYGIATCKARIFSTYGRGLHRLAIWDITRRALAGEYIIHGTGNESRDYLHVKDIAYALEHIVKNASFNGEVINIASGHESRISEIAHLIYYSLGIIEQPQFNNVELAGSPTKWKADIKNLHELGFTPKINLELGIQDTVNWIKNNA